MIDFQTQSSTKGFEKNEAQIERTDGNCDEKGRPVPWNRLMGKLHFFFPFFTHALAPFPLSIFPFPNPDKPIKVQRRSRLQ